jgi:hypothetical protein
VSTQEPCAAFVVVVPDVDRRDQRTRINDDHEE